MPGGGFNYDIETSTEQFCQEYSLDVTLGFESAN